MCLRIGKLSITERIGGQLRLNMVQTLDRVLEQQSIDMEQTDSFSAPVVAWFKPRATLDIGQLLNFHIVDKEIFLCTDAQQQFLIEHYFTAVLPVCHVISRKDLQDADVVTLALRSALFFTSSVSLSIYQCSRWFNMTKEALTRKLKTSAELALSQSGFLNLANIKVFQALVIYLTPQMTSEISPSFSIFLAMVIQHFRVAGFDQDFAQDAEHETQIKRHTWQHLLFLNIRCVEAIGPERTLIDDNSLVPLVDSDSCLVAVIRYECYKIHRLIFTKRDHVHKGELSWITLLELVEKKAKEVRKRYMNNLNDDIPLQKYARLVGELLLGRCETMVIIPMQHLWKNSVHESHFKTR